LYLLINQIGLAQRFHHFFWRIQPSLLHCYIYCLVDWACYLKLCCFHNLKSMFLIIQKLQFFLSAFKRPRALLLALIIAMTFIAQRYIANFSRKRKSLFVKILLWPFYWAGFFRREILVPFGIIYFLFFFINSAKNEAIRLVFENDSFAIVSTRFGEPKSSSLIPIGTTERF